MTNRISSELSIPVRGDAFTIQHDFAWIILCSDLFIVYSASMISGVGYHLFAFGQPGNILEFVGIATAVSVIVVPLMRAGALYGPAVADPLRLQVRPLLMAWGSALLSLAVLIFTLKLGDVLSRGAVLSYAVIGAAALCTSRTGWAYIIRKHSAQLLRTKKTILISWRREADLPNLRESLISAGYQLVNEILIEASDTESCEAEVGLLWRA